MSKEDKKAYVYKIINKANGKIYIGSTIDAERRKGDHFRDLRRKKHCNNYLQKAWNKYGEDSFEFEVIEVTNLECQYIREQYYLDTLKPFKENGYNLTKNAYWGHKSFRKGESLHNAVLKPKIVKQIKRMSAYYVAKCEISKELGITDANVASVSDLKVWDYIATEYNEQLSKVNNERKEIRENTRLDVIRCNKLLRDVFLYDNLSDITTKEIAKLLGIKVNRVRDISALVNMEKLYKEDKEHKYTYKCELCNKICKKNTNQSNIKYCTNCRNKKKKSKNKNKVKKIIFMYNNDYKFIKSFETIDKCSRYLKDNNLSNYTLKEIAKNINTTLKKRTLFEGFYFRLVNSKYAKIKGE